MGSTMDFEERIRKVGDKIAGCYFLSLAGYDGITIAQHVVEARFDSAVFDAQMAVMMSSARAVSQDLNLKKMVELIWLNEEVYVINYFIRDDYFLYAAVNPRTANPGLARIEIKRLAAEIEKVLYEP